MTTKNSFSVIDYILVIVSLLFTGKATEYTGSIDFRVNPIGGITLLVCLLYMFIQERNKIRTKEVGYGIIVASVILLVQAMAGHEINIVTLYSDVMFVMLAWLLVKRFDFNMLPIFEKVITYWSLICLLMYALQELVGKTTLLPYTFAKPNYDSIGSFVFFSLSSDELTGYNAFDRNYGFAWEPGLYASIVCTAIVINIFLHKGQMTLKNNKNLWILILSVLSTGSTTGYLTFGGIILFEILKTRKLVYKILALCVIIPSFIYLYNNTDFLSGKVSDSIDQQNFTVGSQTQMEADENGVQYTPQRFEGVSLQFLNAVHEPLTGYGFGESWVRRNISQYISVSTGIFAVFAQFGILFGILYCFAYCRSYWQLGKHFNAPPLLFLLCYLMISVSYSFVFMPLYLCINFFSFFYKTK